MYAMDPQAARKADTTGGQINELGKYVGAITQAVDITAKTGTKGIALSFQSNAGQKTRVSLYTKKSNGEMLMGYETLCALMTCLKLRNIAPVDGSFVRWDNETNKEVSEKGKVFPDLCKPIGMLLETEDYTRNDGGVGTRMVLKSVFQADTELTSSEILDRKTQPEQLARMVQGLRHRPIRGAKPGARTAAPAAASSGGGSGFDDMDDDIPF